MSGNQPMFTDTILMLNIDNNSIFYFDYGIFFLLQYRRKKLENLSTFRTDFGISLTI